MVEKKKTIVLFDVDGTLTEARKTVKPDMVSILRKLRGSEYQSSEQSDGSLRDVDIGVVGGSDLDKQKEQLGPETLKMFDFNFAENGVVAYKQGEPLATTSITEFLGEEKIKKFINFVLHYVADLDIPVKRGTFIEYRTGMLNVSPIGRNCSREERNEYEKYDLEHKVREKFVAKLREEFADYGLNYSIGGQISFDVFPIGWDKTFCLQYLKDTYDEVHFFGDKTFKGGNDFEIFSHPEVKGHTVTSPEDTIKQLGEIFGVKA